MATVLGLVLVFGGVWLVKAIYRDVQREERAARAAKRLQRVTARAAKAPTHARTPAARGDVANTAAPDDAGSDAVDDPGDHLESSDSGGGWRWDDD